MLGRRDKDESDGFLSRFFSNNMLGPHDELTEIEAVMSSSGQTSDPIPPPSLLVREDSDDIISINSPMLSLTLSPHIGLHALTPPTSSSHRKDLDCPLYTPLASPKSAVGLQSAADLDLSDVLSPCAIGNYSPSSTVVQSPELSPKSAAPSLIASFASSSSGGESFVRSLSSSDTLLRSFTDVASTPHTSTSSAYNHSSDATNESASASQIQDDFLIIDDAVCVWRSRERDEDLRTKAVAHSRSVGTQLQSLSLNTDINEHIQPNKSAVHSDLFKAGMVSATSCDLKEVKQEPLLSSSQLLPMPARTQRTSLSLDVQTHPSSSSVPHDLSRAESPAAKRAKTYSKRTTRKWSEEEDNRLAEAVQLYKIPNWTLIAKHVKTRTCKMCSQRWRHVLRPENKHVKKGKWSKEEDETLRRLVSRYINTNERAWDMISADMHFTRNSIQCRERWTNFLDPTLNLGPWTKEEDALLMRLHAESGKKWKTFTTSLGGRSAQHIRRRFDVLTQDRSY